MSIRHYIYFLKHHLCHYNYQELVISSVWTIAQMLLTQTIGVPLSYYGLWERVFLIKFFSIQLVTWNSTLQNYKHTTQVASFLSLLIWFAGRCFHSPFKGFFLFLCVSIFRNGRGTNLDYPVTAFYPEFSRSPNLPHNSNRYVYSSRANRWQYIVTACRRAQIFFLKGDKSFGIFFSAFFFTKALGQALLIEDGYIIG